MVTSYQTLGAEKCHGINFVLLCCTCKGLNLFQSFKDTLLDSQNEYRSGYLPEQKAILGGLKQLIKWKGDLKLFFVIGGDRFWFLFFVFFWRQPIWFHWLSHLVTLSDNESMRWLWCNPCLIDCSSTFSKGPKVGDANSTGWMDL